MSALPVGWYLRRLRRMSPAEIWWRTVDTGRRAAWTRRQVRAGDDPPPPRPLADLRFAAPLPPRTRDAVPADASADLVRYADEILAGRWSALGVTRDDMQQPDWFRDPVTGRRSEPGRYSFRVPYRSEAEVGNVKQVWELSRLHHLTVVAAAWYVTEDAAYAKYVDDQLRSWWRANPRLSGIHWTSGIELGIRLINLAWIRRLLDGWSGAAELFEHNDDALRQLRWHQEYLHAMRSRGSSANNHLIAEASGQLVATCAFPWFAESRRWRMRAAHALESSLADNTFDSGLNRELASEYHGFVAELGLVAAVEADAAGHPLSSATWALLGRMLDAAAAVADATGRPPRQGDGDDGQVLVVDAPVRPHGSWRRLLGLGRAVFGGAAWWPPAEESVLSTVLPSLLPAARAMPTVARRPDHVADAGMTLLRTPAGDDPEIWCRCDAGPHGFLSIAGHAHADALSVEVRYDGVDILADPGTYCYHGEPGWRSYFRSTRAHNTVEIDGQDQSVSGGPFLWTRHAATRLVALELAGTARSWSAEHDGYARLDRPVTHRRSVTLDDEQRSVTIVDTLSTDGPHAVRLSLHLGPDVGAEVGGSSAVLTFTAGGTVRHAVLDLPAGVTWTAHRGETDPAEGWHSPSFGVRVAATTLVGRTDVTGDAAYTTTLRFDT